MLVFYSLGGQKLQVVCSVYDTAKMRSLRMVLGRCKGFATKWHSFKQTGIYSNRTRTFSSKVQQPYFITTPIFYVNAGTKLSRVLKETSLLKRGSFVITQNLTLDMHIRRF